MLKIGENGGMEDGVRFPHLLWKMQIQFQMPERKVWSVDEDTILKKLIEERGLRGWTQIARIMQEEFKVFGRSGKQCRERYHNHLDGNISTAEWTPSEEDKLFSLQDQLGNKWKLIASSLPGRTDNCIKNHFYSKLRKSLRSINRKIHRCMKKDYKQIKTTTLYRLIETLENRNKNPPQDSENFALCRKIKNHLYHYEVQAELQDSQELQLARTIIEDFALFDKDIKRPKRGSLQSSAKLSQGSRAKGQSTRSLYDDESECSSLFSSSSFDHRSLCGSQRLPTKLIFRSQDIQSESESDSDCSHGQVLYKSATSLAKAQHLMPPIQQESAKRESSKHSHSSRSDHQAHPGDMFEDSMEMRAISPQQLTTLQKMEIRDQSNDALFYGEMEIEDGLASDFSRLALSSIPVLTKYTI